MAGVEDQARGQTRDQVVESFMHFKLTVIDRQSRKIPGIKNELVIATVLNPPKLVWFQDNGPQPRHYRNMLPDIKELNLPQQAEWQGHHAQIPQVRCARWLDSG